MRHTRFFVLALVALAPIALSTQPQASNGTPDLSKGVIDGRQAVMFVPSRGSTKTGDFEILDCSACSVHLVPEDDVNQHFTFPCSEWFLPPRKSSYAIWLEDGNTISPSQSVLWYAGAPFRGRGTLSAQQLVEGGFIRIVADADVPENGSVRLLGLDSPDQGFERRVAASRRGERIMLPTGQAIVGIFSEAGDALALSAPLKVESGSTVFANPTPPREGTDLLLVATDTRRIDADQMEVGLSQEGTLRRPDVLKITAHRIFAVWYGVNSEEATITVSREADSVVNRFVRLTPKSVLTVRESL